MCLCTDVNSFVVAIAVAIVVAIVVAVVAAVVVHRADSTSQA